MLPYQEGTAFTGPWNLAAQIKIATTPRKSNANILSVPNIVTTHNREGRIFVGEERPVISSYLNDGISGTGSSSGVSGG
jgi:general secretion pathway protein D